MDDYAARIVKELRDSVANGDIAMTLWDGENPFQYKNCPLLERAANTIEEMNALLEKYRQNQRTIEEEDYVRPICIDILIGEVKEILHYARDVEQIIVLENVIQFMTIMTRALTDDEIFESAVALSHILAVQRFLGKRLDEASNWIESNRRKEHEGMHKMLAHDC